ncbi:hypothetical protein CAPTEDRAFT_125012, partial [Capitella teleta]
AFSVAGPCMWNTLPLNLRAFDNAIVFKRHLKTLLLTECYQDLLRVFHFCFINFIFIHVIIGFI